MKDDRAETSIGSSFVDSRIAVGKLSWLGHTWSTVGIGMEINGQGSCGRDCCVGSQVPTLVASAIMLYVVECGCIKDWAWTTVIFNGLLLAVVQEGAIMSVAEMVAEEFVGQCVT